MLGQKTYKRELHGAAETSRSGFVLVGPAVGGISGERKVLGCRHGDQWVVFNDIGL
jgi:hypothetical protein